MGNASTVGNNAGKVLQQFTDVGQDSGPLSFGETPIYYKSRTFQLLIGASTGIAVRLYGTLDVNTANGDAGEWFELPAPNTEASPSWSNPLQPDPKANAAYMNAPCVAVRAVSEASADGNPVSGAVILLMLAAP